MRHNEREKNVLVDELASQNARLTQQLQAANQLEVQLTNKLAELKSQYNIQHQTLQVRYESNTRTIHNCNQIIFRISHIKVELLEKMDEFWLISSSV